jgi:hypothetical protein
MNSVIFIQMFWAAMSDLPRLSVMKLLQAMWLTHATDLPDEMFFWKDNVDLLGNFRVATLENSTNEFWIEPIEHTIYIPTTPGNFAAMQINLKDFVDSL